MALKNSSTHRNNPMQYGFVDYLGNAWGDPSVDTYNRFNDEVNKRDIAGLVHGSLAHQELEFYHDQRHKQFMQTVDVYIRLRNLQ